MKLSPLSLTPGLTLLLWPVTHGQAVAQDMPLLREAISREYSIHVGGLQTPTTKEVLSREFSVFVGAEPAIPHQEALSRELSLVVSTEAVPSAVAQLTVAVSPTGERATLDWRGYDEFAQHDLRRYDIYVARHAFSSVDGMTPYTSASAGIFGATLEDLPAWQDRYFAVVPVDVLGGFNPNVTYAAAYVVAKEAISREVSLFVGAEPAPPHREVVSRELSIVVSTDAVPSPVAHLRATPSPTGETAILDWSGYDEWAEHDVSGYDLYVSDRPFSTVAGMTPDRRIQAGMFSAAVDALTAWRDHYFAVVPVDVQGGFDANVTYAAAYVVAPELVSREFSVFVGDEPPSPQRELVSREVSLVVSTADIPEPVSTIEVGFAAKTSTSAYTAIDVDWSGYNEHAQHDVSAYRIYLGPSFFDTVTGLEPYEVIPAEATQHTVGGLMPGGIYYVAVVAQDVRGQWNPTVRSASAKASIGELGEVGDLAVVSGETSLQVTWTPPEEAETFLSEYRLYFAGAAVPEVVPRTEDSLIMNDLLPAHGYPLRITTLDTFGIESAGASVLGATWLDNPHELSFEPFDGMVRLRWQHVEPNALVKHYAVYQATSPLSSVAGLTPVITTRARQIDLPGLENGLAYHFAVTTVNIAEGERPTVASVEAIPTPRPGEYADLHLAAGDAPSSALPGSSIDVTWRVRNDGLAPTRVADGTPATEWVDELVLSANDVLGDADDLVVGQVIHLGALLPQDEYQVTTKAQLPHDAEGEYRLFFIADAADAVYEHLDSFPNEFSPAERLAVGAIRPPEIAEHPEDRIMTTGDTTVLHVVAQGAEPLAYQWYAGDSGDTANPVEGATAAEFATPALTESVAYWVRVTNPAGHADSEAALVTVLPLRLEFTFETGRLRLEWAGTATLQMAETLDGDWTALPEAVSPYEVPVEASARFYRLTHE